MPFLIFLSLPSSKNPETPPIYAISSFIYGFCFILYPNTLTSPLSVFTMSSIHFIVVVFPAPFGPINPVIYPPFISNSSISKIKLSYDFLSFLICIAPIYVIPPHKYS